MSNKMLRAALAYQKMGYYILPLHAIDKNGHCTCYKGSRCDFAAKHPRTNNGLKDASNNQKQIIEWYEKFPNSNIGLLTGKKSGIVVIDVDINKDTGKYGDETLLECEKKYGKLPETAEQITGSGGRHLLFKAPKEPMNNRTGFEPYIDFKAEDGYIIAAPSIHKCGNAYVWELSSHINEVEIAELPKAWEQALRSDKKKSEPLTLGKKFPDGTRNDNMFKIACSLHAKGYDYVEIKALMDVTNKNRGDPPLDDSELNRIIKSTVERYEDNELEMIKTNSEGKILKFDNQFCIFKEKTGEYLPKNVQLNIETLLDYYNIKSKYNEMTKNLDVEIPDRSFSQDNTEELVLQYIYNLGLIHKFSNLNKDLIKAIILDMGDRNKYNPAKIFMDDNYKKHKKQVEKNGYTEFEKLANTLIIKKVNECSETTRNLLLKKWLISCVEALYSEKGIASQGILVLQGPQGFGKTTWLKNIFKVVNDCFAEGVTLDPSNKDSVSKAVSYWICELGEIESTFKKDLDHLKAFITNTCDVLRKPYARGTSYYPRRTIFCGSVNGEQYLKDDTGNRRFWTIPIESIDFNADVNYELLWAEIRQMHINKENYWLDKEELKILNDSNKLFENKDYIDTLLDASFNWDSKERYRLKVSDIFILLGKMKELSATKIGKALNKRNVPYKVLDGYKFYEMPKAKNAYDWKFKVIESESPQSFQDLDTSELPW